MVGASMFLAGCAKDAPQDVFQPKGENAAEINDLQYMVFGIAGVVGVIMTVLFVVTMTKFRDKGQPIPEQSHGKPALEITLTFPR